MAEAGISGAVEDGMREARRELLPLMDAEQLEMLRDQQGGRNATLAVAEARKVGRPKGALNKRTAKFRDQILAMGPHPALALVQAYSRPVEVLAAELGCSKLEAFNAQVRAAAELLPYVEGKQPQAVDVTHRAAAVLVMAGPGSEAAVAGAIAEHEGDLADLDWSSVQVIEHAGNSEAEAERSE